MSRMESHEEIAYGQGETILLVEDDPKVRKTVGAMLDFLKYQVLIASSGQEALRVCDDYRDEIAIVLTGLFMPGVDGVVTIRNLRQRFPNIRIAVLTGYPLQSEVKRILSQESVEVLPKPVDLVRLAQFIDGYLKGDSRVN